MTWSLLRGQTFRPALCLTIRNMSKTQNLKELNEGVIPPDELGRGAIAALNA